MFSFTLSNNGAKFGKPVQQMGPWKCWDLCIMYPASTGVNVFLTHPVDTLLPIFWHLSECLQGCLCCCLRSVGTWHEIGKLAHETIDIYCELRFMIFLFCQQPRCNKQLPIYIIIKLYIPTCYIIYKCTFSLCSGVCHIFSR